MSVRSERITRVGTQTCERRMTELGPWKREEGQDYWQFGNWATTQEEADAEVAEFMAKSPPGSSIGNVLWPVQFSQPRTCSFCGSVHPDDAVALIRAGWIVEGTTKGYKRYLSPPATTGGGLVPPVKLYLQHCSCEQIGALNAAVYGRAP